MYMYMYNILSCLHFYCSGDGVCSETSQPQSTKGSHHDEDGDGMLATPPPSLSLSLSLSLSIYIYIYIHVYYTFCLHFYCSGDGVCSETTQPQSTKASHHNEDGDGMLANTPTPHSLSLSLS